MTGHQSSADDQAAVASLPASSPVTGNFWISTAEAKALGIDGPSATIDGSVGFEAGNVFDYDSSNGVASGQYDFFGVVVHEITEVMGRQLLVGQTVGATANSYEPLDLFHYSAAGDRDFVGTTPGYFSIDGGVTKLLDFNTNPAGDFGDWATSAGTDAFHAFGSPGNVAPISETDLREMDVLGWTRSQSGPVYGEVIQDQTTQSVDLLKFAGTQLTASDNIGPLWNIVADGDFNGDGRSDFVTQQNGQIDFVYMGQSGYTGSLLESGTVWDVKSAGSFDFLPNTSPALVTQNTSGQIDLLSFSGSDLQASALLPGSYWNAVGVGDFNGDGKQEIVTQNAAGQIDLLWFSDGHLTNSLLLSGSYWDVKGVDNYNHDGHADIVTQNAATGQIDHLSFTGAALTSSLLEDNPAAGSNVVQGTHVATDFWHI